MQTLSEIIKVRFEGCGKTALLKFNTEKIQIHEIINLSWDLAKMKGFDLFILSGNNKGFAIIPGDSFQDEEDEWQYINSLVDDFINQNRKGN